VRLLNNCYQPTPLLRCLPIMLILRKTPIPRQSLDGLPHGMSLGIVRARRTRSTQDLRENKKSMKPAEGSTVIGKSVIIRGGISGNEDLYIDGDVEGTVTLPESRLTIGPNARVRADISAREVVIFGHLTGNVQATGRVDLRQSAFVSGDILAGRLSIEESAVLTGRVELKVIPEASKASASAAAVPAPAEETTPLFTQPKA
jgi:cytoskeletal protein CcmA (bactofilin family)